MTTEAAPKRPRHLMDPDNLQRPVNDFRLTNVQRWVWTVTVVFTVAHLAAAAALASLYVREDATAARIGLNVIAALLGVLGVASGFLLHAKQPWRLPYAPWLLLGLLPGIVGMWLALR